jgi:hypothetical protein
LSSLLLPIEADKVVELEHEKEDRHGGDLDVQGQQEEEDDLPGEDAGEVDGRYPGAVMVVALRHGSSRAAF